MKKYDPCAPGGVASISHGAHGAATSLGEATLFSAGAIKSFDSHQGDEGE